MLSRTLLNRTAKQVRHTLGRGHGIPSVCARAFAGSSAVDASGKAATKSWVIEDLEQITNEAVTLKMVNAFQQVRP